MLKITVEDHDRLGLETPMLAMGIFEGEDIDGAIRRIDQALGGVISRLKATGEITGKKETVTVLHTGALVGGKAPIKAERVAIVGRGKREDLTLETVRTVGAVAANKARELRLRSFALTPFGMASGGYTPRQVGQALAEGIHLALYRYDRFKSERDGEEPPEIESVLIPQSDQPTIPGLREGVASGERLWRMPLWPEYREQIKAPLGDFKNIGGQPAGSITAAWFLANFVGDVPWAHLDIAGTAWTEGGWAVMPPYLQKDVGTGVGVRLLTHFANAWAA